MILLLRLRQVIKNSITACFIFWGIVSVLPLFSSASPLQREDHAISWAAHWIWQEQDGPANTWICFRKAFTILDLPSSVTARIAVDSKYWLYINGDLAVFEGGLNRGPTPATGYYESVDIRPYLVEGENLIAVLVWYWGNQGRNNVDSGKGGLLFQADIGESVLLSDSSWKIKVHPAYGSVPFEPGHGGTLYLYGGWNIGFDARNDIPDWNLPGYNDAAWLNATEKGVPPSPPWNELSERPIPRWKDSGLQDYANAISFPEMSDGNPIVAELPYNAQVTAYFKIDAAPGLMIEIKTDHYEVSGYFGHRTEYFTKGGIQEFEALDWQNGEQVLYDIPAGIQILELKYRETGYATDFAGSFVCDDDFINLFCEKARRTLYVCMRDNYMDCPDRERGQWIGDVAAQIPQTFYALDRNADRLTLKTVNEFIDWRAGYILRGLAPGAHAIEYPSQSLNAVSDIGIMMTYYMHTGDLTPIVKSYTAIRDYLYLWSMNGDGLINSRSTWNGQGILIDHKVIENTWYYMALKSALRMAQLTGNTGDCGGLQGRLDMMAANFDRAFWRGDGYRSSSFNDDRANALVLLSGLAGEDKWPAIGSILRTVRNAGPYMEGYVLEAMCRIGNIGDALQRMKDRYALMVAGTECTTLWESFSVHLPGPHWPDCTRNHAWSGAPLTSLYRYVAGISPERPGYSTYHILPRLGPLVSVQAAVPSIRGDITVSITRDESEYLICLASPYATEAIVGIPKNAFGDNAVHTIKADDRIIWRNGSYTGGATGISWNGEDNDFYKFNVMPGTHTFAALETSLAVELGREADVQIISSNFPNPFNDRTTIRLHIPVAGRVAVKIYNLQGYEVRTLLDEQLTAAVHVVWDGTNNRGKSLASGVYIYEIISAGYSSSGKMMLIR